VQEGKKKMKGRREEWGIGRAKMKIGRKKWWRYPKNKNKYITRIKKKQITKKCNK
jgi:hypothetical protein